MNSAALKEAIQMNACRLLSVTVIVAAMAMLIGTAAAFQVSNVADTATHASASRANVPRTMRAVAFDQVGGPEVLTLHTLPVPEVAADEVLIAVHTAGVAVWDAEIRRDKLGYVKLHFPFVLGSDGSGTIAAVGSAVTRFKVGDAVYSYNWNNPKGGFYAEFVAVPAIRVAHVPK